MMVVLLLMLLEPWAYDDGKIRESSSSAREATGVKRWLSSTPKHCSKDGN